MTDARQPGATRAPTAPTVPVVRFTVRGEPVTDAMEATTAGASGVDEGRPYVVVYDGHCKVCGRMVRALRKWDARSRMLEILPSQWPGLAERFYRWFARNRYRLGCGEHCQFRPTDLDYGEG